jgi:hypothetical protein
MVFKANPGGKDHLKARDRVIKLLESRGFYCEPNEVEFKDCETELGLRDYTTDIVATLKIIVEIDGETHWSKAAIHKDKVRDLYFNAVKHTPTLRIQQNAVTGKNEEEIHKLILAELLHQVWGLKIA